MKNRFLLLISIVIMIIALLFMGINWLTATMPDWSIRVTGLVIMVDLVVFAYASAKLSIWKSFENKNKERYF